MAVENLLHGQLLLIADSSVSWAQILNGWRGANKSKALTEGDRMVRFELFAHTDVGDVLIYAMTSYTSLQPSTTALSATVRCTVYLGESTTLVAVISRSARARHLEIIQYYGAPALLAKRRYLNWPKAP